MAPKVHRNYLENLVQALRFKKKRRRRKKYLEFGKESGNVTKKEILMSINPELKNDIDIQKLKNYLKRYYFQIKKAMDE